LIVGSANSANAMHIRINDDPNVYLVSGIAQSDITPTFTSWVDADTSYFSVKKEEVVGLRIDNAQGSFNLQKPGATWVWDGLQAGQILNSNTIDAYLNQLTSVKPSKPLGKTEKDEYGLKKPSATVVISVRETVTIQPTAAPKADVPGQPTSTVAPPITNIVDKTYTLLIGAKVGDTDYVIKLADSPYYVQVPTYNAETFISLKASDLVTPPTATPTPTVTATATITPTPSQTPAVTATPTGAATTVPTAEATQP